jgi:hypothetical protein
MTIRHLQKQMFLNDRVGKVGTGCFGRLCRHLDYVELPQ